VSDEVSAGGSRIYRHSQRDPASADISGGDPNLIEGLHEHLDKCFGGANLTVFHELASPTVHVDVHLVGPSPEFEFNRLVTCGMAEKPMTVPDGFNESPFAELTVAVPANWPLTQEAFRDEDAYWPVRLLKMLARLPHEFSTFLWNGHTIPNGDPPRPYASSTKLCCALIATPLLAPDNFRTLALKDGRVVRFLAIVPLYEDEMRLKLDKGADALYDLFQEHVVTDLVDSRRPSVVPQKRRFFGR
jgi:hypothetical protein